MINGEKVVLRPIEEGDLPLLYEWLNREWPSSPLTLVSYNDLVKMYNNGHLWSPENKYLIMLVDNTPVGEFVIRIIHPSLNIVELGCYIEKDEYHNKGIGHSATNAVLKYLYNNSANINRIQAITNTDNHSAISVLEKCGFRKEGLLKEAKFHHGKYYDLYMYAITREELK